MAVAPAVVTVPKKYTQGRNNHKARDFPSLRQADQNNTTSSSVIKIIIGFEIILSILSLYIIISIPRLLSFILLDTKISIVQNSGQTDTPTIDPHPHHSFNMCCGCLRRWSHEWAQWHCGFVVSFMILLVLSSWMAGTKAVFIPNEPPKLECVLYEDSGTMCASVYNIVVSKYTINAKDNIDRRILSESLSAYSTPGDGNSTSTTDNIDKSIHGQSDLEVASQSSIQLTESTEILMKSGSILYAYLDPVKEARARGLVDVACWARFV